MRFWEMREPAGSDYANVHLNGRLVHPYRMPDVECETCGEDLGELDAVHLAECPDSLKKLPELTGDHAAVSMKEFRALERKIIGKTRKAAGSLKPGGFLQPGFLDVPSAPKGDFLWSGLRTGIHTMVVSARARDLLQQEALGCVEFAPAIPRRIGKRSPKSKPNIPKSGEPEDMMDAYPTATGPVVGDYFQLIVTASSGYLPGTEPGPVCKTCGTELDQDWTKANSRMKQRETLWKSISTEELESIWSGAPMFHLLDQGLVLVSEPLKTRFEVFGLCNVAFREFPPPSTTSIPKRKKRSG